MKLFSGITGDTDIENRLMDTVDEVRKEWVGCTERVTWKLTLPYAKQIVNGNLLYDSNRGSVTI